MLAKLKKNAIGDQYELVADSHIVVRAVGCHDDVRI